MQDSSMGWKEILGWYHDPQAAWDGSRIPGPRGKGQALHHLSPPTCLSPGLSLPQLHAFPMAPLYPFLQEIWASLVAQW